jgi:hypothetical protein
VTAGENGGDEVLDDFLVADDLATDLLDEGFTRDGELLEQLEVTVVSRSRWARLSGHRSEWWRGRDQRFRAGN